MSVVRCARPARALLFLVLAACSRPATSPPPDDHASRSASSAALVTRAPLAPVSATRMCVTSGALEPHGDGLAVRVPEMRAVVAGDTSNAAELRFTYRGPSAGVAPLAHGELRRQIGLKLRAQDSCNVVYVMWRIEPKAEIVVSVKRNAGKSIHLQCGASGYDNLHATAGEQPRTLRAGEAHVLRAELEGSVLRVHADGALAWEGTLPAEAFAFDGPAGVRSDNGSFDFALHTSSPASPLPCPAHARTAARD